MTVQSPDKFMPTTTTTKTKDHTKDHGVIRYQEPAPKPKRYLPRRVAAIKLFEFGGMSHEEEARKYGYEDMIANRHIRLSGKTIEAGERFTVTSNVHPAQEVPPLPGPLLPGREEREKSSVSSVSLVLSTAPANRPHPLSHAPAFPLSILAPSPVATQVPCAIIDTGHARAMDLARKVSAAEAVVTVKPSESPMTRTEIVEMVKLGIMTADEARGRLGLVVVALGA